MPGWRLTEAQNSGLKRSDLTPAFCSPKTGQDANRKAIKQFATPHVH